MKKIVRRLLSVALLTVFFYLCLAWVITHVSLYGIRLSVWMSTQFQLKGGVEYLLGSQRENNTHYDVVVIGSSHAYRGYDPREFENQGFSMYNFGTHLQNPLASYLVLTDVVHPDKKNLVVFDIYDDVFQRNGIGSYTRLIENVKEDSTARKFVYADPDIRLINSYTCRLFSKNATVEIARDPNYIKNGYYSRSDTAHAALPNKFYEPIFIPEYFDYVLKTIEYCQRNAIPIVLVSHPQPINDANLRFHDAFLKEFIPKISGTGIHYLDYQKDRSFKSNEDFMDAGHLNQTGVTKFNKLLIKDLLDLKMLEVSSVSPSDNLTK